MATTSTTTPRLGMQLMSENILEKEVIFNEALLTLDVLFSGTVVGLQDNPPGQTPPDGTAYIVGNGAYGAFSGNARKIAFFYNGWQFIQQFKGLRVFNQSAGSFFEFNGSEWQQVSAAQISHFTDLVDVNAGNPTDGMVIQWVASTSKWTARNFVPPSQRLDDLGDVVISGTPVDGQQLVYDAASQMFVNKSIPSPSRSLTTLSDVDTPHGGQVAVWNDTTSRLTFVAPKDLIILSNLNQVGDVFYPDGGPKENDQLTWNGAAWTASSRATVYMFSNMLDGPRSMSGAAGKFMVVNDTEDHLVFTTLHDVVHNENGGIALTDLKDFPDIVGNVGQALVVGQGGKLAYADVAGFFSVKHDNNAVDDKVRGFNVTGNVEVDVYQDIVTLHFPAPPAALDFYDEASHLGPAGAIRFLGNGVTATIVDGQLQVEIDGVSTLAALSDVNLANKSDGHVLTYDQPSGKWVSRNLQAVVAQVPNTVLPNTYELGDFAPPTAAILGTAYQADGAIVQSIANRGLLFAPTRSGPTPYYALRYHQVSATTPPWSVTCRVSPATFNEDNCFTGIMMGRSVSGYYVFFGVSKSRDTGPYRMCAWWVTNTNSETKVIDVDREFKWLQMSFDGINIIFRSSVDGILWFNLGTVNATTALNGIPNRAGIGVRMGNSTVDNCGGLFTYYDDPDLPASQRTTYGYFNARLSNLGDVDLSSPAQDGQALVFDAASGKFKPKAAGSGGGGGGSASYPRGGVPGKALVKKSSADNDVRWSRIEIGAKGVVTGQKAYNHYKLLLLSNGGAGVFGGATMKIYDPSNNALAPSDVQGATPYAGNAAYIAGNLADDNEQTFYCSNGYDGVFVEYIYDSAFVPASLMWQARDGNNSQAPLTADLYGMIDDGSYEKIASLAFAAWTGNLQKQTVTFTPPTEQVIGVGHDALLKLTDVSTLAPKTGQVPTWNDVAKRFDWRTPSGGSGGGGGGGGSVTDLTKYTGYRLVINATSRSSLVRIVKLLITDVDGTLRAPSSYTVSSEYSPGYQAAYMFDDDNGSQWASSGPAPQTIELTFGSAFAIGKIGIQPDNDPSYVADNPRNITVYGLNGTTATEIATIAFDPYTASTLQTKTVQQKPTGSSSTVKTIKLARLRLANAWTVPNGWTNVPWDTEVEDELSAASTGAGAKITIPAGVTKARLTFYASFSNNSAGTRFQEIIKNDGTPSARTIQVNIRPAAFETGGQIVSEWLDVVAGDTFSAFVNDNNYGTQLQGGDFGGPSFFQAEFMVDVEVAASGGGGGGSSGTAPELVQSASVHVQANQSRTVVLPADPTPGNLLVALHLGAYNFQNGQGLRRLLYAPGWSEIVRKVEDYTIGSQYDAAQVLVRKVKTGDTKTVTFDVDDKSDVSGIVVVEFEGASEVVADAGTGTVVYGTTHYAGLLSSDAPSIGLAMIGKDGATASTPLFSPDDFQQLAFMGNDGPNHVSIALRAVTDLTAGPVQPWVTWGENVAFPTWITLVVKGTPATGGGASGGGSTASSLDNIKRVDFAMPPGYGYYYYVLNEIEFLDSDGIAIPIPAGYTASASSQADGYGPANAFDGNKSNWWGTANGRHQDGVMKFGEWVSLDLGANSISGIVSVRVTSRGLNEPSDDAAKQTCNIITATFTDASGVSYSRTLSSGTNYTQANPTRTFKVAS